MPLRIDIKAGEPFLLNNTTMHLTKSAGLIIESKATFIRVRDLVREGDIDTAAERVLFLCQQIYLSETRFEKYYPLVRQACADLLDEAPGLGPLLLKLETALARADFYRAMKLAHELVELQGGHLRSIA